MPAKVYNREYVIKCLRDAVLVDVHLPRAQRQLLANSWPATSSFSYEWLHRLTEDFAPLQYIGHPATETEIINKIETLKMVAMRWFEWIDSVNDRKILWLNSGNVSKTEIGRKIGEPYKNVLNHYNDAVKKIVDKLNETKNDSDEI